MWQLKEPSKPKCVCAHAQFITSEHMACILTHVSQARKTNRDRPAWGRGPFRWGGAAAVPGPGGWGGKAGSWGLERGARPRSRASPRHRPSARYSAAARGWRNRGAGDLPARGVPVQRRSRAPGEPPAPVRGRVVCGTQGTRRAGSPEGAQHRHSVRQGPSALPAPAPHGPPPLLRPERAAAGQGTGTAFPTKPCHGSVRGLRETV